MRILGGIILVMGTFVSSASYILTNVDQRSNAEITFWLIEQQTTLGFPIWALGLPLMGIGFFLFKRKSTETKSTVLNTGTEPTVFTPPDRPVEDGGKLAKGNVDESAFMSDWMLHVRSEIKDMILPTGAQIVENPTQGVQLGLILTRTTPQSSKQAFHSTAEMLSKIPTPRRFRIELIDVMATGVPIKNMAIGGFSKFFAKQDFIITEQIDGLDIRFNRPDECWNK